VARRSVDFVAARQAIESPTTTVLVSAGSLWKIVIKSRLGKLSSPSLLQNFDRELEEEGFVELPITAKQPSELVSCPGSTKIHSTVLIAQAAVENVPIVSRDPWFDEFPIDRIW
jgi:PIN domain nuclease of toxin-antitoxin system